MKQNNTREIASESDKVTNMETNSELTIGKPPAPLFTTEAVHAERQESDQDSTEESSLIPLSDFTLLPENPQKADAVAFVESAMTAIGLGFHPDTDFAEYIHGETGRPLFSHDDSLILNWQIVRAGELLAGEEEDVCDVCIRLAQALFAQASTGAESGSFVIPAETG